MTVSPAVVLIAYRCQPDRSEAARARLRDLPATVVASEEDCLGIDFHQSADGPRRFMLFERWTSREAYEGPHKTTPHLLAFIEDARQLFVGPPEISFWYGIDA